jgi:hypothetical protein
MSLGGYDIFLAKYNAAGAHQWSHRYGDNINDYSQSIAVDFAGDVYANGYYEGSVDFGGGELTSFGGFDVYLAKYDTGGNHVWSRHGGGPLDELGASVAVDQFGVVITGYFNANANFGGAKLTSAGGFDAYLAKYSRGFAEPIIGSVEDIGNDQGGKVKILFSASGGDDAYASNPVSHYVAFRRDDPPPPGAIAPLTAAPSDPLLLAGWIQVGSVDAFVDDSYEIVVPTIGDSTIANGQYWSAFMIRAATGLPSVYYSSPPDSGYSLDNLAPGAPTNLVLAGGQLYWSGSSAPDFDYFTVYGSNTGHFADALVIGYTVANHLSVFGSPYPYYLVTATDFSGNESLPGSTADPTGVGGAPVSYVLSVTNFPNPFNPQTSIRYTVPSRGTVAVRIYDARGALVRTLFDGDRSAGAYSIEWNGRADNGDAVASGVYFVRIEQNGATRTKKMVMLK